MGEFSDGPESSVWLFYVNGCK